MKKRFLIPLFILLGLSAIPLMVGIFYLYTEAEKVQRSIFVNEVFLAGNEVVDRIDATIKNDTAALIAIDTNDISKDFTEPNEYLHMQNSRKFLIDTVTNQPIGVINSRIYYLENDAKAVANDTEYFTAAFRTLFPLYSKSTNPEEIHGGIIKSFNIKDKDLIQLDSTTKKLINRNFLEKTIREALLGENIDARFDFALYNAFTSEYVVEPQYTSKEKMQNSQYLFLLKYNEKVSSPHYLILYFPTERGIFLTRMKNIVILIIVFFLITFIISFTALYSLHRQKKTSDVTNEFINNVTHEFKTPIATISLACEALSDSSMSNDKEILDSYISIINDENNRLKEMVNTILEIAQLRKGQVKMNIELIDMHELIKKITDSLALMVNSSNGDLKLALNAQVHSIFGDRTHLSNTLTNLIENGIKYSPDHPEILIYTLSDDKYFSVSVTDKGIGIPKKSLSKIFNNFYRIPHGNVHDVKGFGLGLGYVKKIVSLHHGKIEVQSEEGKGSTFTIHLPIKS